MFWGSNFFGANNNAFSISGQWPLPKRQISKFHVCLKSGFPILLKSLKFFFCRLLSYQPKDSFPSLPCGKMYLLIEAETSKLETFRSENIWEEIKSKGFLCLPLIFSRHVSRLKTLKSDFLWRLNWVKSLLVPCNGYLWTNILSKVKRTIMALRFQVKWDRYF